MSVVFAVIAAVIALPATARGQCVMDWADGFGPRGVVGDSPWTGVRALAVFDDGTGPVLCIGGEFDVAADIVTPNIVSWNGSSWSPLGAGLRSGDVEALVVFDDGSGPTLYAAADHVHKWDGSTWSDIGPYGSVFALAVFDDGGGPALYAGGDFGLSDGSESIAKWDGTDWSPVGGGVFRFDPDPQVHSLTVFDDGSGPALYVGGEFTHAGGSYIDGVPVSNIAKWDGQAWSALGGGVWGCAWGCEVLALGVYDDGSGPALYVGGDFVYADSVQVNGIAKWDGSAWSDLAGGVDDTSSRGVVHTLLVHDDGSGPVLIAGGRFRFAGGSPMLGIARWDGAAWQTLGNGAWPVEALAVYDDGQGEALYAGGGFVAAGDVVAIQIAKWDGASWSALADGEGMSNEVNALIVFDDGSGPAVYAGGDFGAAGGTLTSPLARWDGAGWSVVGAWVDGRVYALGVLDDGRGPALYIGGSFSSVGGVEADHIAKWDGFEWSALGLGTNRKVYVLAAFDDGSGPALYVGGDFDTAGGVPVEGIARWDGQTWSDVGGGVAGHQLVVYSMAVFDDGSGPGLYVGGLFDSAGGVLVNNIAKWDGQAWSALGAGLRAGGQPGALAAFDDGTGPALYVGGSFRLAGDLIVENIAKWDGQQWSDVGDGVEGNGGFGPMAVFDDGSGPVLTAAGLFHAPGGAFLGTIAVWNGSVWAVSAGGPEGPISALAALPDESGPHLYAGGAFTAADGHPSAFIARWDCVATLGDCNCDGTVDSLDIDSFVLALVDGDSYTQTYPDCDIRTADCSRDGLINLFDIDPFVELLPAR